MGNQQVKPKGAHKQVKDQYFGNIVLWENLFQKDIPKELITKELKEQYTKRINLNHPNLIKPYRIDLPETSQACSGNKKKLTGYWEYPGEKTLEDVIQKRKVYWQECQIWMMISQVVSACTQLQKIKLSHGDIRPKNLLINDDKFKLAEHTLVPGLYTNYQNALFGYPTYLAPEQLKYLKLSHTNCPTNQTKADVYSFGLTLINIALVQNQLSFQDHQQFIVNTNNINQFIQQISKIYSVFFVSFLQYLLNENESERPTFAEINQLLKPYYQQIQDKQPFQQGKCVCTCKDNKHHHNNDEVGIIQSSYRYDQPLLSQNQSMRMLYQEPGKVSTFSPAKINTFSPETRILNKSPSTQGIRSSPMKYSPIKQRQV